MRTGTTRRRRPHPRGALSGSEKKSSPFRCSGLDEVRAMTTDASDPRPLNGLFAEPANAPEPPAAHAPEPTRTHAPKHPRGHVRAPRWVGSRRYLVVAVASSLAGLGLAHVVQGSTREPVSGRTPAPPVVVREASPARRVARTNTYAARRTRPSRDRLRRVRHGHRVGVMTRIVDRSAIAPPRLHLTSAARVGPRRETAPSGRPAPAPVGSDEFF